MQFLEAAKKQDGAGKQAARTTASHLLAKFGLTPASFDYRPDGTVTINMSPGKRPDRPAPGP